MKRLLLALILLCGTSWGTVSFVNDTSGTADNGDTTIAATAASHTAGNLLVVHVMGSETANTVSSIADTAGNTYTQGTSCRITSAAVGFTDIWYAKNITGNASNTVTATLSGTTTFRRIVVDQYSGADTVSPFEVCATGSAAASTSVTSGSFSPAAANNVNSGGASSDATQTPFSAGTNYTLRATIGDVASEDRIGAPSGSQTASISGAVSANWLFSVASFKQAGAAGPPAPVKQPTELIF